LDYFSLLLPLAGVLVDKLEIVFAKHCHEDTLFIRELGALHIRHFVDGLRSCMHTVMVLNGSEVGIITRVETVLA
jgi:hypothetical protein